MALDITATLPNGWAGPSMTRDGHRRANRDVFTARPAQPFGNGAGTPFQFNQCAPHANTLSNTNCTRPFSTRVG